ncbi:MAG: GNAT family N-acetyltransferase [Bacillota bacterium]
MPRIYGNRVMLREYRESDFEPIRAWVNNPEVVQYLSDIFLYPQSEKQTRDFLDNAMQEEWKGFIIAEKDSENYIGQVDLVELDQKNGVGELGIVIGSEENHNQGYGTEALKLFLDFCFDQLRLHRVELVCWEHNHRGQHVYEKLGFVKEGIRREKRFRNGRYYSEYCYGILKDEWKKRKKELEL